MTTEEIQLNRRKIREQAFVLIFEKSFTDYEIPDIVTLAIESRDIEPSEEAEETAGAVFSHVEEIDSIIESNCKSWSRKRISRISLAILRLAIYEIKYVEGLDAGVSINEAVELAKKYSGAEEASFVNGVLGGYISHGDM